MGEIKGRFFVSNKEKPCFICKKPTNQIEILSEKRICSDFCLRELEGNAMKKIIYIRFNGFDYEQFEVIDKIFFIEENIFNIFMRTNEDNFLEYFVKISNGLGDFSLLSSKLLDILIETGDIISFEKNKKRINNKSRKFDCFFNVEIKTLSSYFQFQILEIPVTNIKEFNNSYIIKKRFS